MKRNIVVAITLIVSMASLHAQQPEPGKPVKTGNEWRMPASALQRSHQFADSLKKNLGLDDATAKKLFDIYLSNTKSVDEISIGAKDEKQRKDLLKANQNAFNEKMQSALSPGQYRQYMKASQRTLK